MRRIIAEGSSVGVLCSDNVMEDYEEAAELVFEAARVKTLLVASSGNKALCAGIAAENGLVFWDYGLGNASGENLRSYYPITAQLERAEDRADICLRCDDNTAGILYGLLSYLISSSFELRRPRETDSIFQSE